MTHLGHTLFRADFLLAVPYIERLRGKVTEVLACLLSSLTCRPKNDCFLPTNAQPSSGDGFIFEA